jgi:hypothetical protein
VPPARARGAAPGRRAGVPRVQRRTPLRRAPRGRHPGVRPRRVRAPSRLLARRGSVRARVGARPDRGARELALARGPGRARDPARAAPTACRGHRPLAAARAAVADGARGRPETAGARQLPHRRSPRERRLLHRRARHAGLGLAGRGRSLVPHRLGAPRDGARRHRRRALPSPGVRRGRHRKDARPARSPRPPRAVGLVGPHATRDRGEHRHVRADHGGALPRRAVLRHGAARRRPRAAGLPGRPLLVQHLGAASRRASYFRFDPVAIEFERESWETRGRVLPPPEAS